MSTKQHLSRLELLQKFATAPIAIGAFAALQAEAQAKAKAPQIAVLYRKKPHGNKECDECAFFIPVKGSPKANGSCKRVAGSISPEGYCVLWHDGHRSKKA